MTAPLDRGIASVPNQSRGGREPIIHSPVLTASMVPVVNPADHRPTVLVADPVDSVRAMLHTVLTQYDQYRIVHTSSVVEVDGLIASGLTGDLALVSVHFKAHTPRVVQTLRAAGWSRVIAITTPGTPAAPVIAAFGAGATGVVVSSAGAFEADPLSPARRLSGRELEVVRLVAEGCTNKEIAEQLALSALTVKNHMSRIGRKLGVGDRAHIVAIACRGGVIPLSMAG